MKNMWTRNQGDYTAQDIERWSNAPPDSIWAKWCGGFILPLLILWPAVHAIITLTFSLYGRLGCRVGLVGMNAWLMGYALVCLALFFHAHYFWGNSKRLINISDLGKILGLSGFSICALWLVYRLYREMFTI